MNDSSDIDCVTLKVTKRELRYLIACGPALAQNIPSESLPTYCGMTKDEIIAVTLKLRALANNLAVDV